jgi:anti-sigma-K factor RskA
MFCDQCSDLLSDYIDGSLELGEQVKVEHHVAECEHCRGIRDDLLQIVQFSRKLPLHAPPSSLWLRIKSEIDLEARPKLGARAAVWWSSLWQHSSSQGFHWATAAATLAGVAILVIVVQTGIFNSSRLMPAVSNQNAVVRSDTRTGSSSDGTRTDISDMEQRIQALAELAREQSVSWSPDVKSAFNRDMSYVDETLAQCHHELSDNPHDDVCREMMLNAYREKVRLLEGFTDY